MMKKFPVLGLILAICFACSKQVENKELYKDATASIEDRVNSLISQMTLEEKIGQMNQYNGFWDVTGPAPDEGDAANKYEHLSSGLVGSMLNVNGVKNIREVQKVAVEQTRLGIPLIIGYDVIHGYKTQSPIPLAESASWDLKAIQKSASMAALEASASGINWTFAPMVDIYRDARWGRVMEGAGEDPYLGSLIAAARVKGFQGDDLSSPQTIAACAKHFAAYGFAESGRDYNTADLGTSTLYNVVLPPFKAALDAGARTFMNSFNEINGIPATGHKFLQRDILKGKWGFDGFVVSDWGSIEEMIPHGYAKDKEHAAEIAANAGSDMDMESYAYVKYLVKLVEEGRVNEDLITDAAKRVIRVKFELGLFDDPYKYLDEAREKEVVGSKEIHEASLDMAKKSVVLLKNENNILPLQKQGQKIALIGALASDKSSPLGGWRGVSQDGEAVSVLEGMQQYKGNKVMYAKGADVVKKNPAFIFEVTLNEDDKSGFSQAVSTAKKADVVVMVLGEVGFQSGEGRSRSEIGLPGVQQELLEKVYAVNKNVVLVLNNGRPLALPWAAKNIPAIVEGWHLGNQTGNAIAQVLYGDYNPSGKLPMSFPRAVGQSPLYYNYKNTGRPTDKGEIVFWSHYSDVENTPLFPFGHGLSYTQFKYSDISVSNKFKEDKTVEVTFSLTNTGDVKGKEVVQLYIQDLYASVTRPVRELKGFDLVELNPGESKTVTLKLTEKELGFFDNQGEFLVEKGDFKVYVGGSSITSLESKFSLE